MPDRTTTALAWFTSAGVKSLPERKSPGKNAGHSLDDARQLAFHPVGPVAERRAELEAGDGQADAGQPPHPPDLAVADRRAVEPGRSSGAVEDDAHLAEVEGHER